MWSRDVQRRRLVPLSKKDVVTLALADLDGATRTVDTEDIAIQAHDRAPEAFGWRKYTERVDLDMVRTTLRHEAEGAQPRVAGSIRDGWCLTPAGVSWTRREGPRADASGQPKAKTEAAAQRRAETRDAAATAVRLKSSAAYRAWAAGEPVSAREAAEVFRIDHYTSIHDRHLNIARAATLVAPDNQLSRFIEAIQPAALSLQPPQARRTKGDGETGSP